MNIQRVEIVIHSNQDPSRIARLTVDEIRKLGRFPSRVSGVLPERRPSIVARVRRWLKGIFGC